VKLEELQEELGAGQIRPAYLLGGSEPLLRDDALAALCEAVLAGAERDFNLDRLDGATTTPGKLLDAVRMLPVLAERRLVVLRDPEGRRAGSKSLVTALPDAVAELGESGPVVLVVCMARLDRRAAWVRAFRDPSAWVDCDAPRGQREVVAFVRAEARRRNLELGKGAAELLAERVGPQLLFLRHELEKAALFAGENRVERSHVVQLVSDVAEEPIWDLTDAIGEGRVGDALVVLGRLVSNGAPAPVLLGSLASHFRRLARVRTGGSVSGPPFVKRKLEGQARRYSQTRVTACLRAIAETDEALKGKGSLPPELALERLVLGLAG